jgi:hypothetical protein
MTIVENYVTLLRAYNLHSANAFAEFFYKRMARSRFEGILKAYQIRPEQHQDRYVVQALGIVAKERTGDISAENKPQHEGSEEREPADCLVVQVDGRKEYIWPETVQIAPTILQRIDEEIKRTTDDARLSFLRRRREKFQRALSGTFSCKDGLSLPVADSDHG